MEIVGQYLPDASVLVREVLTGAIGGGVVAGGAFLLAYLKRKRVELRYPLGGEYASYYEDFENGEVVVVPSRSTIRQRGRSIKVVTEIDGGRSWTLDGTIISGGHVSGVYSADAAYDEGVGAFYLKIDKYALDGVWSGYDHINKITNSGRYWFRKLFNVRIRKYRRRDLTSVLHASSKAFGDGYIDTTQLVNDASQFCLVATYKGEFTGFCFGHIAPRGTIRELIRSNVALIPDDVKAANEHGTLGVIKSIAIREKFRGHGIGAKLIQAAERELGARNVEAILVPAWTRDGRTPIEPILVKAGYRHWLDVEGYWQDACESGEFACIALDGRCRCAVRFFRKARFR